MTKSLFEKNLVVLRKIGSEALADRMSSAYKNDDIRAHALALIVDEGVALYGTKASDAARFQINNFDKLSQRILCFSKITQHNTTRTAANTIINIEKTGNYTKTLSSDLADPSAGFLVCLGVGLGTFVAPLLQEKPIKHLLIFEPESYHLLACFLSTDLQEWCDILEARGGALSFLEAPEPDAAIYKVLYKLRGRYFSMLDGSYIFKHYESEQFTKIIDGLIAHASVIAVNDGFFEDEMRMLDQAVQTCRASPYCLLADSSARRAKSTPVFIVGAGPSLDIAMPYIKKFRDRIVLISCSTGIRPILAAGLLPDFHAEVENTDEAATIVQTAADEFGLRGACLLGSTTLSIETQTPFQHKLLNWREASVPTRLFATPDHVFNFAVPTVTNFATRAAISLGFFDIRLFGVDLGSVDPDKHHSEETIYFKSETNKEFWQKGAGAGAENFALKVPGNFRDHAYTNTSFLAARQYFERLINAFPNRRIANCSDGARIEGAIAIRPEEMVVDPVALTPQEAIQQCIQESDFKAASEEISLDLLQQFAAELSSWFRDADTVLEAHSNDPIGLVEAMVPLLGATSELSEYTPSAAAKVLVTGTITTVLQYIWTVGRRLPADQKEIFATAVYKEMLALLSHMQKEGLNLVERLIKEASDFS